MSKLNKKFMAVIVSSVMLIIAAVMVDTMFLRADQAYMLWFAFVCIAVAFGLSLWDYIREVKNEKTKVC